jgi:hypothetical protein
MTKKRPRTVGDRVKLLASQPDPPEPIKDDPSPEPLPFEKPWGKVELAAFLGMTPSGVDKLIGVRRAPPGFRAGRLWRWRPSIVRAWAEAQERAQAERDAKAS